MKKQLGLMSLMLVLLTLSSCGNQETNLEGYWLNEYGHSISFDGSSQVVIDNHTGTYSVYDQNKLTIEVDGYAVNYNFIIDSETLTMNELDNGNNYIYFRNEEKQQEIRDALDQLAQQQAEHQAQLTAEEALIAQITELENQISSIDRKINSIQFNIDYEQSSIDSYTADINRDQGEHPDLIEVWQELISWSEESISKYRQELVPLETEKANLKSLLESLQAN